MLRVDVAPLARAYTRERYGHADFDAPAVREIDRRYVLIRDDLLRVALRRWWPFGRRRSRRSAV
jgi:hypothetical protein